MLNAAELEKYHADGYVTPAFRLPERDLEDIRARHDRLVARHPEYRDYCPNLLAHDLAFLNWARVPEILDMVEQVIGPDIALWNSSFFAKPALNGRKTPWHQDGGILAPAPARDLHGVDRGGCLDRGKRLPERAARPRTGISGCARTTPMTTRATR